jgi:hypothetical protein
MMQIYQRKDLAAHYNNRAKDAAKSDFTGRLLDEWQRHQRIPQALQLRF